MLYDLCSDLHIDSYRRPPHGGLLSVDWAAVRNPGSTVLAIIGDTHNHYRKSIEMAALAAKVYDHVIITDGNHEHYSTKRPVTVNMRRMAEKAGRRPWLTYLDGTSHYRHGDVVFVGCNGWYNWEMMCPEISREHQYLTWLGQFPGVKPANPLDSTGRGSNDKDLRFSLHEFYSRGEIPADPSVFARIQADRLAAQVEAFSRDDSVRRIVVLTHTAPRRDLLPDYPGRIEFQRFNGSYGNPLMAAVAAIPDHKIIHWGYGHTHHRHDRVLDGILFVNNARGYASEQDGRSPWAPVQLDTEDIGPALAA
jgi:hypothetical protein